MNVLEAMPKHERMNSKEEEEEEEEAAAAKKIFTGEEISTTSPKTMFYGYYTQVRTALGHSHTHTSIAWQTHQINGLVNISTEWFQLRRPGN